MKDHKRLLFLILAVMLLLLYTNTGIASAPVDPVRYLWLEGIEGNSTYKGETGCFELSLSRLKQKNIDLDHVFLAWTCSLSDIQDFFKLCHLYDLRTSVSHGKLRFTDRELELQDITVIEEIHADDGSGSLRMEATAVLSRDFPPTGDTVPVVLYGTLLAVSAATIILLRRKHSRL